MMRQFFENDNGVLSMTRLLSFMAYFPAAYVVYVAEEANKVTMAAAMLTAYVVQSGVNTIGNAVKGKPDVPNNP